MPMTVSRGVKNTASLERPEEVDEVATALLFLASDESRFVAGEALFVDGSIMAV
ncbi:SDR family oxidoreductase [Leclercia adecarboxylata]|uniref:SDR family oxidoreductase n=2 Tax=Leclercia adecarboxylata TaxID=83655 RepID=UPI003AFB5FF7